MDEVTGPASKPRGLLCRGGAWHIDKRFRGRRLYKSLDTTDYAVALQRFNAEVANYAKQAADAEWDAAVRGMLEDKKSWLHKTHARLVIRSRASGRACTITVGELAGVLLESERRCMVTRIPFSDWKPEGARVAPFQMSVDRIDSSKGYEVGNCRVVLLCVNLAMRDWGEDVLLRMSKALVLKHLQDDLEKVTQKGHAEKETA